MRKRHVSVAIIGGGPSGLTAAAELASTITGDVLVLERETEAGGIPRHSDHPGYGIRDLRRFISGPAYARRLVARAEAAGAEIMTGAMVTGWPTDRTLDVTTPDGLLEVTADAVVLATGARERPRPARGIAGDRPAGVFTTGELQNAVHLHGSAVGKRAVVVGAELVSWSVVLTLRHAGCSTVLMTSCYARPEAYGAFTVPGRLALRVPVATSSEVAEIRGKGQVDSVVVRNTATGETSVVEADTVVLTGDWIPDHELARWTGLDIDRGTLGPVVDAEMRTSRPGVFACGNVVHPVDTADIAAIDGRYAAAAVREWLTDQRAGKVSDADGVAVECSDDFRWVFPQRLAPGQELPRNRLLLWPTAYSAAPVVVVRQGARELSRSRLPWPASPGRVFRVPSRALKDVDPLGPPIVVSLG